MNKFKNKIKKFSVLFVVSMMTISVPVSQSFLHAEDPTIQQQEQQEQTDNNVDELIPDEGKDNEQITEPEVPEEDKSSEEEVTKDDTQQDSDVKDTEEDTENTTEDTKQETENTEKKTVKNKTAKADVIVDNVFIDGVSGNDGNNGLTPTTAVKTFQKARLLLTTNNATIWVVNNITVNDTQVWESDPTKGDGTIMMKRWITQQVDSSYTKATYLNQLITMETSANLTLQNIIIDGGSGGGIASMPSGKDVTYAIGSLIYRKNNGKLIINDGAILQNNYASKVVPGTVDKYTWEGSGAAITDAYSVGVAQTTVVFEMNGGEIKDNLGTLSGAIFAAKGGKYIFNGGYIHHNNGGIGHQEGAGALSLSGNSIADITSDDMVIAGNCGAIAGGISVYGTATVNIMGGKFHENYTTDYAAENYTYPSGFLSAWRDSPVVNISGGEIYNNRCVSARNKPLRADEGYAGAINLAGRSTLNLSGGRIHDNIAGGPYSYLKNPASGGILTLWSYAKIDLSGNPQVYDNHYAFTDSALTMGDTIDNQVPLLSNRGWQSNLTKSNTNTNSKLSVIAPLGDDAKIGFGWWMNKLESTDSRKGMLVANPGTGYTLSESDLSKFYHDRYMDDRNDPYDVVWNTAKNQFILDSPISMKTSPTYTIMEYQRDAYGTIMSDSSGYLFKQATDQNTLTQDSFLKMELVLENKNTTLDQSATLSFNDVNALGLDLENATRILVDGIKVNTPLKDGFTVNVAKNKTSSISAIIPVKQDSVGKPFNQDEQSITWLLRNRRSGTDIVSSPDTKPIVDVDLTLDTSVVELKRGEIFDLFNTTTHKLEFSSGATNATFDPSTTSLKHSNDTGVLGDFGLASDSATSGEVTKLVKDNSAINTKVTYNQSILINGEKHYTRQGNTTAPRTKSKDIVIKALGGTLDPIGYIAIPQRIDLIDGGGIDANHAGRKTSVSFIDPTIDTSSKFKVDVTNAVALKHPSSAKKFLIDVYDTGGTLLPTSGDVITLGSLSEASKELPLWLNTAKNLEGPKVTYQGIMTFYITQE